MSKINIVLLEMNRHKAQSIITSLCQSRCDHEFIISRALREYGELTQQWVKVQAVLTAAEEVRQTPFYQRVALLDAVTNLNNAVRALKESEAKDEQEIN